MREYTIARVLTEQEAALVIERLTAYAREYGDYGEWGEDGHKTQRVVWDLVGFIERTGALPDVTRMTEAECDAMMLSDANDFAR